MTGSKKEGNPRISEELFDVEQQQRSTDSLPDRLADDIEAFVGDAKKDPEWEQAIGTTMFDVPDSEDNTITVLLPEGKAQNAPSQALVRIKSRGDGRNYLGIVTAGPFAEPDGFRGDSHILVSVATRGTDYQPPFHGRVHVAILGEELSDGALIPARFRPLPNSLVLPLSREEAAGVLKCAGDLRLGLVVGYENVIVGVPSDKKAVLPRHTAVLGTTGSGKSTTIACLVQQAQAANMSVILLDVEGEYTRMNEPTTNERMKKALLERGLNGAGIPTEQMALYHLVGRDTANPDHPNRQAFSLQFARLSPYAVAEILDLSDPQQIRFMRAYDIAKEILRDLEIFPKPGDKEQERLAMEIDEFERGYPRLTLSIMMDVVAACLRVAESPKGSSRSKEKEPEPTVELAPFDTRLKSTRGVESLRTRIYSGPRPDQPVSWRALLGRLARLNRLKVFDNNDDGATPVIYKNLLKPGTLSVVDLSDSGASGLNNIVIADLLQGIQAEQDEAYQKYEASKRGGESAALPSRTLVIIEEAHEFLSAERIDKMRILFEQVARIAKRGRKRWLGLVFVTQLPQHLPRQIFGLVNSYVLHKITDPQVVNTLRNTVSGIDDGLWKRVPALAPGQAIVSFPHMERPLLVSIDPAPGELRLVD